MSWSGVANCQPECDQFGSVWDDPLYYFEVSKASSDDDDKGDINPMPADLPGEDVDITPGAGGDAEVGEPPAEAWGPGDEGTPGELSWN
jgi:hypothetical protein